MTATTNRCPPRVEPICRPEMSIAAGASGDRRAVRDASPHNRKGHIMKRILIAAALIAAIPSAASATDWWAAMPKVIEKLPFNCVPASQGFYSSPMAAYEALAGSGKVSDQLGNVEVCGRNSCFDFFRSEAACEKWAAAVDKLSGEYQ